MEKFYETILQDKDLTIKRLQQESEDKTNFIYTLLKIIGSLINERKNK